MGGGDLCVVLARHGLVRGKQADEMTILDGVRLWPGAIGERDGDGDGDGDGEWAHSDTPQLQLLLRRLPPRTHPHRSPKTARAKEYQFVYRNGSKLHAYDRDKAPYPCSFDRDVVELQCLDNSMIVQSKGSASFIDFKDKPPKRCLDIGTGLGLWVISSAKAWPESTFVGLDMVHVQVPLQVLQPGVAERIEWVHTNILRNKLPFDDDEFDHVHIQCLAMGIPENKVGDPLILTLQSAKSWKQWPSVFEEIRRVMKPGATIEILEEDAIFPVLPRWYTDPLRAHGRGPSTIYPGAVQQPLPYPSPPDTSKLAHEHELLETLYHDVWANRFINPTPSSCLPGYFGAFFERVLSPPVLKFSTPPLAPFAPLAVADGASKQASQADRNCTSDPGSGSVSSLLSPIMTGNTLDRSSSLSPTSTQPTSAGSVRATISPSPSMTSLHEKHRNGVSTGDNEPPHSTRRDSEAKSEHSMVSQAGSHSSVGSGSAGAKASRRPSVMLFASSEESTSLGGEHAIDLIPFDSLQAQEEHSQFMHLYRAVTSVLATKEAMWEELEARVAARDPELVRFGWREEDYNERASRARFELAVDQYQSDMRGRIALWHSLVRNGWELPRRDPLSQEEIAEEMALREDILTAQRLADTGEPEPPCRKVRLLVGVKES
ncbi:hypothetical protein BD414DRAFT_535785 [Trametes punicea]|nr:hypothetical protein BD414DRAFT_535785 [Trametes punicea]